MTGIRASPRQVGVAPNQGMLTVALEKNGRPRAGHIPLSSAAVQ
jgi:hypothetical protein